MQSCSPQISQTYSETGSGVLLLFTKIIVRKMDKNNAAKNINIASFIFITHITSRNFIVLIQDINIMI